MSKTIDWLGSIQISDEPAAYVIYAMLGLTVLGALWGVRRKELRWRTAGAFVFALIAAAVAWYILEVSWRPFPDRVPYQIYVAGGLAVFVLVCLLVHHRRRRLLALLTVVASICAFGVFNLQFQEFPTVRSLNPHPVTVSLDQAGFDAQLEQKKAPELEGETVGALVTMELESKQSGFTHRPAVAYIPPAYFKNPKLKLPVIVLMAGNPGSPGQWFEAGGADSTLDDFQRAHHGVSPIVVSVDGTGTFTGNPICVDGPKDKVQTYLAVDVPAALKEKLRVVDDQQKWTIGGLSYGGTCSLQVVTNHPDAYGTFLDYSGQEEPTVGDHNRTVAEFFGGDENAFQAVNPMTLLKNAKATDKYAHLHGRFVVGEKDKDFKPGLQKLHDAATEAGINSEYSEVPGAHSYQVWRIAFRETLDFAAERGGLK